MRDVVTAMTRTLTPMAAAAVVTVTGWLGTAVDGERATAAGALAVAAGWYLLGLGLQTGGRRAGWRWLETAGGALLGSTARPTYSGRDQELRAVLAREHVRDLPPPDHH